MSLAMLRACVLATCINTALSRCAAGWTFTGDSCFHLVVAPRELSGPEASLECEAAGAVLAQPRNEEQEHMLLALIRQNSSHIWPDRPGQVWVGGWSAPPECERSNQPRLVHLHGPDSHGECFDSAGSSARASLCQKPAADSHNFRRLISDIDTGSGPAAELLQVGLYCVCGLLMLLLVLLRIADLRGGAFQVMNFLWRQFGPGHASPETEAYVQKALNQRRVLLVQLVAAMIPLGRMVAQSQECIEGFHYITWCEIAISYVLLVSCRWQRWRGPWCRLFPLCIAALNWVDFFLRPKVMISEDPSMQREAGRRVLLMICLGPVESLIGNTIYGIALCATYPSLGLEGQSTFFSQTVLTLAKADCNHVVPLPELDSISSMMTECAKNMPDDSPAVLDQLLEILNMIRSNQSSLGTFVADQVTKTFTANLIFLFFHMAMSYDLRRSARTQSLQTLADAMTALMEQFCDASAQLSHDFAIAKPARKLASLLNVAESSMALAGSNFCERIKCERQRSDFISHLLGAKSSVNGFPGAFPLNLKDAFGLEVRVTIISHWYETLGTEHYLIGVTEMMEHQARQNDAHDEGLAPLFFASKPSQQSSRSSGSSPSDCAAPKLLVNVDYIDSELRMQGTNTAFDLFMGSPGIPRGTPLQEVFPDKSKWQNLEKRLVKAREVAESVQDERIGHLEQPLEVKLTAAAGGKPSRTRFVKVQYTARPAVSPDGEQQSQLILELFPCRDESRNIQRKQPRGVTTRSARSDGSSSSEDERHSPSASKRTSRGASRSRSSESDEVGAGPRATMVGHKMEL